MKVEFVWNVVKRKSFTNISSGAWKTKRWKCHFRFA